MLVLLARFVNVSPCMTGWIRAGGGARQAQSFSREFTLKELKASTACSDCSTVLCSGSTKTAVPAEYNLHRIVTILFQDY
jgi:hypothetical protein